MSLTSDQRRGRTADLGRRLALCSDDDLVEIDERLLEIERRRFAREEQAGGES